MPTPSLRTPTLLLFLQSKFKPREGVNKDSEDSEIHVYHLPHEKYMQLS